MTNVYVYVSDSALSSDISNELSANYSVETVQSLSDIDKASEALRQSILIFSFEYLRDVVSCCPVGKAGGPALLCIQEVSDSLDERLDDYDSSVASIFKPFSINQLIGQVENLFEVNQAKGQVESLESQLIQSEKMAALGQLAAGVAHEINNPVGFVSSNLNTGQRYLGKLTDALESLKDACEAEVTGAALLLHATWQAEHQVPEIIEALQDLGEENSDGMNRIRDIVKDLKEYAHAGSNKFERVSIEQLLKSAVNLLKNEIKYKADVEFEFGDVGPIDCISSQLSQVFVNLIVNACHAIEDFGKITVGTEDLGETISISIADTGSGMSEEVQRKVFEPFFTTKPIGKGTGIGLAITHSILERHHGQIRLQSTLGEGTCFTITLPKEQEDTDEDED